MHYSIKFLSMFLLTAVIGYGVVTWETPQNFLLLIIWFIWICISPQNSSTTHKLQNKILSRVPFFLLMTCIYAVAVKAPVKRIDTIRKQDILLPADSIQLSELAEYCSLNRRSLPLAISIPSAGPNVDQVIKFSSQRMPLEQFIEELEEQIDCNACFGGCGNAYTVLHGPAYNFGLHFIPEEGSGYTWD